MNDKNIKPETATSPEGVKKGLTTPVTPTANQPAETPSNQAPSTPAGQSGKPNK